MHYPEKLNATALAEPPKMVWNLAEDYGKTIVSALYHTALRASSPYCPRGLRKDAPHFEWQGACRLRNLPALRLACHPSYETSGGIWLSDQSRPPSAD